MREPQNRTEAQIDIRVPSYVKDRIKSAAQLTGRRMGDFTIAAALQEAEEVTESVERWELTHEQSDFVYELLTMPKERPEVIEFLKIATSDETKVAVAPNT